MLVVDSAYQTTVLDVPRTVPDAPGVTEAERDVDAAGAFLTERGVEFEVATPNGPAAAIVDFADECDADLIVIGAREPGLIERLLHGSVSQDVVRRARHRDVLVVHPDDPSRE
jgi:nucleotide-binding universal stress UspA family protein